jgi:Spy/CpxP family protein refolding chaperone
MTDNQDAKGKEDHSVRRRSRHGFWTGIVAGGLLGVALAGSVGLGARAVLASHLSPGGAGHLRRGLFRQDPELARGHLELMTDWILTRVGATEGQKEQAKRVVTEAYGDLLPLIQEHRSNHETLVEEITKANLDPEAIERLRASQVELFDRASRELSGSLTEIAEILTPEQRIELLEMSRKFHH